MRIVVFTLPRLRAVLLFTCVLLALVALVFAVTGGAAAVFAPKDNIPIYSVKTNGNQIALTLDIAWGSQMTGEQLDIFDKYQIKATFYVTGRWAELNADELREIARRGHEIGSHGHTHRDFVKLSEDEMIRELRLASDAIEKAAGSRPATFRAPYGSWNGKAVDVVCGQQYEFVQWDVDSLDWKDLTPGQMETRVLPKVQSGSILLFHNNGSHTTAALPGIIEALQAKGFRFLTVSELLAEGLEN